jgi:hypothetical protein
MTYFESVTLKVTLRSSTSTTTVPISVLTSFFAKSLGDSVRSWHEMRRFSWLKFNRFDHSLALKAENPSPVSGPAGGASLLHRANALLQVKSVKR